ncbi:MAG TPA: hypothetical protein VMV86_06095, partial [Methanosarcinales archaeon]|nr:hypothetical protein [Methanosarcinales archaeon]
LRVNRPTNLIRTQSSSDYYMNLNVEGVRAGGGIVDIALGLELPDFIGSYDIQRFDIEDIIADEIVAIRVYGTMAASTCLSAAFEYASYSNAKIDCAIQRLT